jgi:hypothetical protein
LQTLLQKKSLTAKLVWGCSAIYASILFYLLREHLISGFDPGSYYLAIKYGFSLAATRPHPPGYPLFVMLWQGIVSILHTDPHSAILILNAFFLFLSIGCCYHFIQKIHGERIAIITTLLLACNPVVIYYSTVSEIYIYDVFFSVFTLYLLLSLRPKYFPLVFFWLGLALGLRFFSVILLAPAMTVAIYMRKERKLLFTVRSVIFSSIFFIAAIAIWAYPYYVLHDGINSLLKAGTDASKQYHSTIYQNAVAFLTYILWSLNFGIVMFFIRKKTAKQSMLLLSWLSFPSFFFVCGQYSKGFILLIIVTMLVPVASRISSLPKQKMIVAGLCLMNVALYFFVPFVPPSIESTLPKSYRAVSERIETTALRSLSFFAPTLAHARIIEQFTYHTEAMLDKLCPKNSFIFIDKSAGEWVYPRSLQVLNPDLNFVQIVNDSALLQYSGSELDAISKNKFLSLDTIYYLADPRIITLLGKPPESEFVGGTDLVLFRITAMDRNGIWKYFTKIKNPNNQKPQ